MTAKELIEQAQVVVSGDRQRDYGHPKANHTCTAQMWSAWLSRKYDMPIVLDTEDVCWMNILQKASRQANKSKEDNSVDVIGYVLNDAMCKTSDDVMIPRADCSGRLCVTCKHSEKPGDAQPCCLCADKSEWEPK
jgi:hypothetical protein